MKTLFFLSFFSLFTVLNTYSQVYVPSSARSIGRNIGNEAADEGVQKGLEALQNSMLKSSSEVEVADVYSFKTSVDITITSFDKKKKSTEMNMRMLFPAEEAYYAIELIDIEGSNGESPESIVVFDYLNLKMISLINSSGQKMGVAMDLNDQQIEDWAMNEDDNSSEKTEFKKTGEKKDILGYSCERYTITNENGNGEYWVSDDDDLKIGVALNSMTHNSSQKKSYDMPEDYPDGAILEMNYTDNDGSGISWLATSIDKNANRSIETAGYTFMLIGE